MNGIIRVENIRKLLLAFVMLFSVLPWFKGNTLICIPLFIAFWFLVEKGCQNSSWRLRLIVAFTALIFTTFQTIGFYISDYENLDVLFSQVSFLSIALYFTGSFVLFYFVIIIAFIYLIAKSPLANRNIFPTGIKQILFFWAIIFLSWFPYAIINYPGILSPDPIQQVKQIMGEIPWSNNNPAFHTFVLSIFIRLGEWLQMKMNFSIFLYFLFQMLLNSVFFSYALYFMKENRVNNVYVLLCLGYFAFYPIHGIYSVTLWSDVLFSGSLLTFTIFIAKIYLNLSNVKKNGKDIFIFLLVSIFMMMIRHTGFYVFIITMLLILITHKYQRRTSFVVLISGTILFVFYSSIFLPKLGVIKTPAVASLSIPIQQIARTAKYCKNTFSEEVNLKLNKYFISGFDTLYKPGISDPIKGQFKEDVYKENRFEFFGLWCNLFIKYPKTYIESFLYGTLGYWYPDVKYWILGGWIYPNDYGIYSVKLLPKMISQGTVMRIVDFLRSIPIIGMFFSIGFVFWVFCFTFSYNILTRNFKLLFIFIPVLVLFLTALASPVFAEFRYVYGMFVTLPLCLGITFFRNNQDEGCTWKKDE